MIDGARRAHDHGMDTSAAALALILAGDADGARMLADDADPVAVAQAARLVIGDLGLDHGFTPADAIAAARWEAAQV